jgi:hypothetical protein
MKSTFAKKPAALYSLVLAAAISACGSSSPDQIIDQPNPSVAFCTSHGGRNENRTGPAGEYGVCKFYGGSECDAWAFYRGECKPGDCTTWETCTLGADGGAAVDSGGGTTVDSGAANVGCTGCMPNPASVNCTEKGGTLEIRTESAGQYGVCKFPGGSECEEWAFFRGECKPGDCATWESCKPAVDGGARG